MSSRQERGWHHVTDALACFHWLRVPERIEYKVAVLTYKILHGSVPRYLGSLVYVAAKATYIRLLHGKIGFWVFFRP